MSDLIERQAVLDWLNDEWDGMVVSVFDGIRALPSAKSEIIRCKGCKHKHLENAVWTCPFGLPGGPDFYCGYGAERRTNG